MKTMKTQIKEAALVVLGLGLLAIAVSALTGCGRQEFYQGLQGPQGAQGNTGAQGQGAGVQVTEATSCPAGGINLETFIDPFNTGIFQTGDTVTSLSTICNGNNGSNGTNGQNGDSFQVTQIAATVAQCTTGGVVYSTTEKDGNGNVLSTSQAVVCNGLVGQTGATGNTGATGATGQTGATGAAGQNAPAMLGVEKFIAPCGTASSPWKEQLVCFSNGTLLADFSATMSGDETRLSFIPAGSYEDTDASGCNFSVAIDSHGNSTVSYAAGSNQYATWVAGSQVCTNSLGN